MRRFASLEGVFCLLLVADVVYRMGGWALHLTAPTIWTWFNIPIAMYLFNMVQEHEA